MIDSRSFRVFALLAGSRPTARDGWSTGLRSVLLIWLIVLGHKPSLAPVWAAGIPAGNETTRPLESESPAESSETASHGEDLYHGQRCERTLARDRGSCKLPLNHLTSHFARGRGFLMAESCYGSEHGLRNGTGAHLRC